MTGHFLNLIPSSWNTGRVKQCFLACAFLVFSFGIFGAQPSATYPTYIQHSAVFAQDELTEDQRAKIQSNSAKITECTGGRLNVGAAIVCLVNKLFFLPAQGFALGVQLAGAIIGYIMNPDIYTALFNMNALEAGWSVVRDLFNILFIFTLLFSAFSTIFQVQKYHLRNTLKNIVIMALLVNFSWPIARAMIDMSNILMFFFLGNSNGIEIAGRIGSSEGLHDILLGNVDLSSFGGLVEILIIDVFMFIYMVIMFAVSFQFVIRLVALLMLLIFSPIGFAGAVIPRMEGLSRQWWEAFIKYCFSGPIVMFMVVLASFMIQQISAETDFSIAFAGAGSISGDNTPFLTSAIAFVIPMAILWGALIAASKTGEIGSSFITGKARGAIRRGGKMSFGAVKGAGKGAARVGRGFDNNVTGNFFANRSGRLSAYKDQFKNISKRSEQKRDSAFAAGKAAALSDASFGADKNAIVNYQNKQSAEMSKKLRENNADISVAISDLANSGDDKIKQKALTDYIMSHKGLTTANSKSLSKLGGVISGGEGGEAFQGALGAVQGKLLKEGKAHEVLASQDTSAQIKAIGKMDAQAIAKNEGLLKSIASGSSKYDESVMLALRERLDSAQMKNKFYETASADARRAADDIGLNRSVPETV